MILAVLIGAVVVLLVGAWLIDRQDRKNGHEVTDAKLLGERIKQARRSGRANAWRRRGIGRIAGQSLLPEYKKPVKRGH